MNENKKVSRNDYIVQRSYSKTPANKLKKRRANGKGVIKYFKNSPNPFMAQVCVEKYVDTNDKIQCKYKSIGSFPLKADAEKALTEFFDAPYELNSKVKTFSDLYDVWFEDYMNKLKSKSSIRTIKSTYRYCSGLYNMDIRKIGLGHIKDAMYHGFVIEQSGKNKGCRKYASDGTKARIKSLCNMMFDYAVERNLLLKNPARTFSVNELLVYINNTRSRKKYFTNRDVQLLWENIKIEGVDIILVGIYTGFRPGELCALEVENIHFDDGYIIGGMKTANGINRMVPIHPLIRNIIEKRYDEAVNVYHSRYLFNDSSLRGLHNITYNIYYHMFVNAMNELKLEGFSPHCTRHTFATRAEICGLKPRAIKLIMGHSQNSDVTNSVYIHTDIEYLRKEMLKYKFEGDREYE